MRLSNKPTSTDGDTRPDVNAAAAEPAAAETASTPTAAVEPDDATGPEDVDPPVNQSWSATFPHMEIDELINRAAAATTLSAGDVTAVLGAIVDEARRLRSTVVRLTAEKLAAAEAEAEEILSAARRDAAELRQKANIAMVSRLDEADSASSAVLHAAQVDANRRSRQGQQLLAKTRVEVEDLRSRVAAIFDSTNGILPLLNDAATSLGRMESEVAASAEPGQPARSTGPDTPAAGSPDIAASPPGETPVAEADSAQTEKSRV